MDSLKWKSTDVLKVSGSTVKKGKFTAGIPSPDGTVKEGKLTDFTPEVIRKIYGNIDSHIPYYLGHKLDPTRKIIGYAYKFGLSDGEDDLHHQGFVFDDPAKIKITTEGHDKISPEIDFTIDSNGNIIDAHLDGMAFVPNNAIEGTDTQMAVAVFSKASEEKPMTAEEFLKDKGLATEDITHVKKLFEDASVAPSVPSDSGTDIPPAPTPASPIVDGKPPKQVESSGKNDSTEDLRSELVSMKTKYEQQVARTEQLLSMQYDGIVGELKELGVENPGEIVKGLPTESKITVLSKMKGTIIKKTPFSKAPESAAPPPSQGNIDTAFKEALSELGLNESEYNKLMGE
jgi:hypothetical protein